jgi:hypothetical protein
MIVFKIYRAIYSACSAFLLADHFCFRKNNYGSSHSCPAHVNLEYPDDRYAKLNIYISELATNTHH